MSLANAIAAARARHQPGMLEHRGAERVTERTISFRLQLFNSVLFHSRNFSARPPSTAGRPDTQTRPNQEDTPNLFDAQTPHTSWYQVGPRPTQVEKGTLLHNLVEPRPDDGLRQVHGAPFLQ